MFYKASVYPHATVVLGSLGNIKQNHLIGENKFKEQAFSSP